MTTDTDLAARLSGSLTALRDIADPIWGLKLSPKNTDALDALISEAADEIDRLQREVERLSTTRPTDRLPEVEIDDDGTVVLSWRDGAEAFDISILPSGKVVGTHSPATRGIKPWTVFLPGRQAIRAEAFREAATVAWARRNYHGDRSTDSQLKQSIRFQASIAKAEARHIATAIEALATPETETSPDDR